VANLSKNTTLKTINFFDNQLGNDTGTSLIDILRYNKNIIKLKLKFNRIQARLTEEIKRLIKNNFDNQKRKYIPNLKREIRNLHVTEADFEQTDIKIQELSVNKVNVSNYKL
jgi:hypothetical protein